MLGQVQETPLAPPLLAPLLEEVRELLLELQLAPQLQELPLEQLWEIQLAPPLLALLLAVVRDLPLDLQLVLRLLVLLLALLPPVLLLEAERGLPLSRLRVILLLAPLPEGVLVLPLLAPLPEEVLALLRLLEGVRGTLPELLLVQLLLVLLLEGVQGLLELLVLRIQWVRLRPPLASPTLAHLPRAEIRKALPGPRNRSLPQPLGAAQGSQAPSAPAFSLPSAHHPSPHCPPHSFSLCLRP